MQFRGHSTGLTPGILTARATAPSSALVTQVDSDGVRSHLEAVEGEGAHLECRLTSLDDNRFVEVGTISFGNAARCVSATPAWAPSLLVSSTGFGTGRLPGRSAAAPARSKGATGRTVSNFLLSDTGDLTDNQLGVVFLPSPQRKEIR